MLLKNTAARLITVNSKDRGAFQIKPGDNPSVEVPNATCDTAFVKALIADGSLRVDCEDDASAIDAVSAYELMSKADLIALCESQDIEVGSRDTVKSLAAKLEEANAAE